MEEREVGDLTEEEEKGEGTSRERVERGERARRRREVVENFMVKGGWKRRRRKVWGRFGRGGRAGKETLFGWKEEN